MGQKQTRRRQHILLYLAGLFAVIIGLDGCALLPDRWVAQEHISKARFYTAKKNFEDALGETQATLRLFPRTLGDQAYFQQGLIYAHPENPNRDFEKSREAFSKVLRRYPLSRYALEAEIWVMVLIDFQLARQKHAELQELIEGQERLLSELDKRRQAEQESTAKATETLQRKLASERAAAANSRADLEKQLNALQSEIEDLQSQIRQLKEIDIGIEEKKRQSGSSN
jgi:DNA repair exonuclease SbcCD ATPase subunit